MTVLRLCSTCTGSSSKTAAARNVYRINAGHHGGLDALTRDVAEEEAPRRAGQREKVVEIAAHIVVRRREVVVGGFQAVRRGQQWREQRPPQGVGEHPNSSLLGLGLLGAPPGAPFRRRGGLAASTTVICSSSGLSSAVGRDVRGEEHRQPGPVGGNHIDGDAVEIASHAQAAARNGCRRGFVHRLSGGR